MTDQIVERLDVVIATVRLAWREELEHQSNIVRENDVDAALLDATATAWIRSGDLQRKVAKSQRVSDRAIRTHLTQLVTAGLIRQRGDGTAREHRATGVV